MKIFSYRLMESVPNDGGAGGGGDEESLRDTLEGAFDEAAADSSSPAPSPQTQQEGAGEDRGDGRTNRGTFAKKAQEQAPAQPDATQTHQQGVENQAQQRDPFARAPQSWKPGAREAWQSLPAQVREEVYRRERESAQLLQETAQARQITQSVQQLQSQFAPALQAEGVDVYTATYNLMNLASRLRFGTPVEKAQLAAQIVRSYGVDIMALDAVLSNAPMPQNQAPAQYQDPRVDQLLTQLNQARQTQHQRLVETATNEVEGFGADKEWFEDVRDEMADLMEVAARRGVDMSLEQAYERACALSPEISKVMAQRTQAASAGTARQSTQRARAAASSVRGTPTQSSTPPADDLRSSIEAAIEQASGR